MSARCEIFADMANETLDDADDQWLHDLKCARAEKSYFALTLGANRRGKPFWARQTHFVGWSERNPRWEIREASLVDAGWMTQLWNEIGQTWIVVHDDRALAVFLRWGGMRWLRRNSPRIAYPM